MLYKETDTIKYDVNMHQYYITDKYLQDNYGLSLGDELKFDTDNDIEKFIKRASVVIYNYFCKFNRNTADYKIYCVASNEDLRNTVAMAIGEFLYSVAQYGFDNSARTGTDSKVEISIADLEKAEIPLLSEQLLYNAGLLFRGTYSVSVDYDKLKAMKEY